VTISFRSWGALLAGWFLCCGSFTCVHGRDWGSEWEVPEGFSIKIDVEEFDFPSAIAFVPNPGPNPKSPLYFVTELRGKVKVVTNDRSVYTFAENFFSLVPPKELPNLEGELGLAAITLDPVRGYVFVSFSYQDTNKVLRNNIVRFNSEPGTFGLKAAGSTSFSDIFRADMSRVAHQIGPMVIDGGNLFVSVGDGGQHFNCQSPYFTLGKILRMTVDGKPIADNPFYADADVNKACNFVWALGLRNAFGLAAVDGRLFAVENGFDIDRFVEIHRGENYGWDGTDWSISMNAPMVFAPTVAPVQMTWLPADRNLFPHEYRSKFFVALSGGKSLTEGVATLDYDFEKSCMASRPRQFVCHTAERNRNLDPVGVAFGPDGLYIVPLYPVRREKGAKGAVLRVSYDPERAHTHFLGRDERAQSIMVRMGCFSCHGLQAGDLSVGPTLDPETLIPRIVKRLRSEEYQRTLREIDAIDSDPYRSHRKIRQELMAAKGTERARLWIKDHVMEPLFDQKVSAMPNLGLTEDEAGQIADFLVRRSIGSAGLVGDLQRMVHPYVFGPPRRRHVVGAFGMGFGAACGLLLLWRVLRRPSRALRRLAQRDRRAIKGERRGIRSEEPNSLVDLDTIPAGKV